MKSGISSIKNQIQTVDTNSQKISVIGFEGYLSHAMLKSACFSRLASTKKILRILGIQKGRFLHSCYKFYLHIFKMAILTVTLNKVTNLADEDVIGKTDPYVKFELEQDVSQHSELS
jgi:hypothetical protein